MRISRRQSLLKKLPIWLYKSAAPLSFGRINMGAGTLNNYAFFVGGVYYPSSGSVVNNVDIYDEQLVNTSSLRARASGQSWSSANNSEYIIFLGGMDGGTYFITSVLAFSKSLTQSSVSSLSTKKNAPGKGSIDKYAVFAGGGTGQSYYTGDVISYDASMTKASHYGLTTAGDYVGSARTDDYLMFAGGKNYSYSSGKYYNITGADAYNRSMTKTAMTTLPVGYCPSGISLIDGRALFYCGTTNKSVVYDNSLTQTLVDPILNLLGGFLTKTERYIIFGYAANGVYILSTMDESMTLTRYPELELSVPRVNAKLGVVGKNVLIAGGYQTGDSSIMYDTVDVFKFRK